MENKSIKAGYLIGVFIFTFILAACGSADDSGAAKQAIENYYRGLEAKDEAAVINASCAAWEAQARNEVGAFLTIEAALEDISCDAQPVCEDGQDSNCDYEVTCQGKFVFTYGEEIEELPLSDVINKAVYEGGEYRMCGYYE